MLLKHFVNAAAITEVSLDYHARFCQGDHKLDILLPCFCVVKGVFKFYGRGVCTAGGRSDALQPHG